MNSVTDIKGWEYPGARGILFPLAVDPGIILLAYDHVCRGWIQVMVVENTGNMVKLHALEGSLGPFDWYEGYDNLQDSAFYLNPGRYDI